MGNEIREAVGRLRGHWFQGDLVDDNGENRCGLGWLFEVHGIGANGMLTGYSREQVRLMNEAAKDKFPDRLTVKGTTVPVPFARFNDHEATSESDVVAVMELAADRWDVEHA